MKYSGIQWIGMIPVDWKLGRYKYCWILEKGKSSSYKNEFGEGLPIIGASEMHGEDPIYFTKERLTSCKKDDILILWDGAYAGLIAHGLQGIVSSTAVVIKKTSANIDSNYLYYQLKSEETFFRERVNGTTIPHMNSSYFEELCILIPPFTKQKAIACFLDKKCKEIDNLLSLSKKSIDELTAYKQSIIIEKVIKGHNQTVKMKDSGVSWIGMIPEHWEVDTIGNLYFKRSEKVSDKDYQPLSVGKMGVVPRLENVAKTTNGDDRYLVTVGNFVINSRSDRRGSCGISKYDGSVSLINIVLKPKKEMYLNYYNWLFHTTLFADEFYKWGHGIVDDLWTTNWQHMKRISIVIPPISEQYEIANYLEKKCTEIDKLISVKQKKIEELENYKKSLIYEYVTGKKEVSINE